MIMMETNFQTMLDFTLACFVASFAPAPPCPCLKDSLIIIPRLILYTAWLAPLRLCGYQIIIAIIIIIANYYYNVYITILIACNATILYNYHANYSTYTS